MCIVKGNIIIINSCFCDNDGDDVMMTMMIIMAVIILSQLKCG